MEVPYNKREEMPFCRAHNLNAQRALPVISCIFLLHQLLLSGGGKEDVGKKFVLETDSFTCQPAVNPSSSSQTIIKGAEGFCLHLENIYINLYRNLLYRPLVVLNSTLENKSV